MPAKIISKGISNPKAILIYNIKMLDFAQPQILTAANSVKSNYEQIEGTWLKIGVFNIWVPIFVKSCQELKAFQQGDLRVIMGTSVFIRIGSVECNEKSADTKALPVG